MPEQGFEKLVTASLATIEANTKNLKEDVDRHDKAIDDLQAAHNQQKGSFSAMKLVGGALVAFLTLCVGVMGLLLQQHLSHGDDPPHHETSIATPSTRP